MKNPGVNPTERIFTPETVCTWLSGLYIARAFKPAVPGTKEEALALAADCGVPSGGPGNFTQLGAGMKKRYGLSGTVVGGVTATRAAVRAAMTAGPCVIGLAGDQLNLIPHYQSNHVNHAIAVLFPFGDPGIQLDPLAPDRYHGDSFNLAELDKFATAAIIFKEPPPDCSAAVKAATDPLNAKITAVIAERDALTGKVKAAKAALA